MQKTVLITGANRGIGLEFVKQYHSAGYQVIATTRNPLAQDELKVFSQANPDIKVMSLDISDDKQLAGLAAMLKDQPIDILISNAGYYGPKGEACQFGQVDHQEWLKTLNINTIAPLKLIEAIHANLLAGTEKKVAFLSSKMGSMADNGSGGSYIYRSSKAALNAVIKSLSVDLAKDKINVISLHPGWVQTDMGGVNALIDTQTSVKGMSKVIAKLNAKNSGEFVAYDGKKIPW